MTTYATKNTLKPMVVGYNSTLLGRLKGVLQKKTITALLRHTKKVRGEWTK